MTNSEHKEAIRAAFAAREESAPDFAATLQAARRHTAKNRQAPLVAAAAAVALLAVVLLPDSHGPGIVADEDLLGATWWTAPSDSLLTTSAAPLRSDGLLPQRQTDIYGELPALVPSTNPGGETLL